MPTIDLATVDVRGLTPTQAWRRRRDVLIAALRRGGVSLRYLADVFDLPHSRIAQIVAAAETDRGGIFLPRVSQGDRDESRTRTGRRSRA